jgi:hypothetical protein
LADDVSERRGAAGPLTFARLKTASFTHSIVYLALLICAFAAGGPQPATFILGLAHGLMVSLRLAVAVVVLGGIGPFFGSYEFVRESRRAAAPQGPSGSD